MAIEVSSEKAICSKCGIAYGRRRGYFPVSYAVQHKGIGFTPVCKDCIESMYGSYLSQCANVEDPAKYAVRQMCRKLDLYWSDSIYKVVSNKSTPRSMMTQYIAKLNSVSYAGKSYDDTLSDEGTLWILFKKDVLSNYDTGESYSPQVLINKSNMKDDDNPDCIPDEIINFWGTGYTKSMYEELEKRRQYYMSKLPNCNDLNIGSEALIRQICNLEVAISKDSASGKSIDKNVNALNTLLGSLNLRPVQRKNEDIESELTNTPLGVWLYRYENKRPLPEIDDSLKDINHIKKYVFTWMGHLCKMLGIKNGYTKMYEEEINRLRVTRPEYDGDDEDLIRTSYSEEGDE